jgi:hypothetical protein
MPYLTPDASMSNDRPHALGNEPRRSTGALLGAMPYNLMSATGLAHGEVVRVLIRQAKIEDVKAAVGR